MAIGELRIDAMQIDGRMVVAVCGEIDHATCPPLATLLERVAMRSNHVSLDFSGVTFMDSAGVNCLLRVASLLRQSGGAIEIVSASARVVRVLTVLGITDRVGLVSL